MYTNINGICNSVYDKLPEYITKEDLKQYIIQLTAEINLISFQLECEKKYGASFNYLFTWKDDETMIDLEMWKRKAFNALYRKTQQLEIMKATYTTNFVSEFDFVRAIND